ncbi:hypothetical protein Acr_00g0068500 [Actinidia rufa]|uniref:Uncharacterized protein n=1 Tax=Actinidia rufa TaxID=165716 RepID=A0A7J0DQQ1_9ERIC|nr:hypothetical protein Acr_00g0068500 [Actinidia rufa]
MDPLSAFIHQVQEIVVPSIETGYSTELKKTKKKKKKQRQGNGQKNSQIKNEVTAHAVKEKQAGDVDDNQCVIYATNDSARSDNNRIHSDGLVENPLHDNRSSTADNQVQDVVELSKLFEARHSNKPKKKKVKELKNPLTEKSATILNKCMQNQAENEDGGQCGNYDRNECARYKTTNVIANERANVPDDDQSNTADHQVQDVSVLSMAFEAGHSNKPKKKKRKGLENPLTEKSATILNKYMGNQVEDEDGGHCGNYDCTECASPPPLFLYTDDGSGFGVLVFLSTELQFLELPLLLVEDWLWVSGYWVCANKQLGCVVDFCWVSIVPASIVRRLFLLDGCFVNTYESGQFLDLSAIAGSNDLSEFDREELEEVSEATPTMLGEENLISTPAARQIAPEKTEAGEVAAKQQQKNPTPAYVQVAASRWEHSLIVYVGGRFPRIRALSLIVEAWKVILEHTGQSHGKYQMDPRRFDSPGDTTLQSTVPDLRVKAIKLAEAELSFCSQLAKAKYLKNSDKGIKLFHDLIKSNKIKNQIISLTKADGAATTSPNQPTEITPRNKILIHDYKNLLGRKTECPKMEREMLAKGTLVQEDLSLLLTRLVLDEEIKTALFGIGDDKTPGLDGLSPILEDLIDPAQSAFAPNRSMTENIYLVK